MREVARDVVRYLGLAAVPALLDVVRSGSRRERIAVARLLGSYPIERAAHRDLVAQEIDGLEERLVEVQLLRADGGDAYALLGDRLEEEATEHVRAVLRLLYADSGDATLTRIERQLWSVDGVLRRAALEALDHVGRRYPEARPLRGLVDDRPLAERAAEAAAGVVDPPASLDDLLRRCTSDGNWVTRLVAAHTIGAAGRSELADALTCLLGSPRPALRQEAERALARLSPQDSPPQETVMTIVERMLVLKETELFRNLDARDLAGIAGVVDEASYSPGDTIMREGDKGDFLAIVIGGKVSINKGDGKGGEFHIRDLGPPELIGEMSLLEDAPRSASVRSVDKARLLLLSRSEFEALTEEYPGIAPGIARVLSRRLQTLTAQTARR